MYLNLSFAAVRLGALGGPLFSRIRFYYSILMYQKGSRTLNIVLEKNMLEEFLIQVSFPSFSFGSRAFVHFLPGGTEAKNISKCECCERPSHRRNEIIN